MASLTALVLSLPALGAPRAYPIPAEPLRVLIAEAEFIVTAQVRETDPRESAAAATTRADLFGTVYVALDVEKTLKGKLPVGTIVVPNELGMICPEPARYEVGTRVLAFLDRTERGGFTTHALSYGAKTLDDAGLAVYLERIEEQFAIERMPEGPERLAAQVEWLVRCAEHPATRWEGAYEVSTGFKARRSREQPTPFARELSSAQRERLRAAYLGAELYDLGLGCLERYFFNDEDPRFLEWQVKRLRVVQLDAEQSGGYGEAGSLVAGIGYRDGRPEVRQMAATFASMRQNGANGDDGAGRLRVVRKLLTLYP